MTNRRNSKQTAEAAGIEVEHPSQLVSVTLPEYSTRLGAAYVADSRTLLGGMPDGSIALALTSPPYALHFKKEYGNVEKQDYVAWFLPFAREIHRTLAPTGSFILNIGGSYNPGTPTRSLYHYKLLIALVEEIGFHLAQECSGTTLPSCPHPPSG